MENPEKLATTGHTIRRTTQHCTQTNISNTNKTMSSPTNNLRQRRTELRFHAEIATDITIRNSYVAAWLKSSLQKFYHRHHNLVDHLSQMTMDHFTVYVDVLFPPSCQDCYRT
jgi:hypothetical protein